MKMKKRWQTAGCVIGAVFATIAPSLNLTVQRKLRPDAYDLGGYVYQLIGRTFEAIGADQITLGLMFFAVLWLTKRYLYHKPKCFGVGEYLLCGFFSVMHLLDAAVRQAGTVAVLYDNMFQIAKICIWLPGMFVLYLCAVRALNEWLTRSHGSEVPAIWQRHPFVFPMIIIAAAWLPHVIVRYPGVLFMDTLLEWHQYIGISMRETHHPPIDMLFNGWLIEFAASTGSKNTVYFILTLLKTVISLLILGYVMLRMNRNRLPGWLQWLSLILFAISPIYIPWITVISKDSLYMIAAMLAVAMIGDFISDMPTFARSKWRMLLLGFSMFLLLWIRRNGHVVVPVVLAAMVLVMVLKCGLRKTRGFAIFAVLILLAGLGIENAIIETQGFKRVTTPDWMALPLQQTARTVKYNADDIPQDERAIIDELMVFDTLGEVYQPHIVDHVRDTIRNKTERPPELTKAYLKVWLKQMFRYPVEYLDAMLYMNGSYFNLQMDAPYYICFTNNEIDFDIYRHSFNVMEHYDTEEMLPMYTWQRAFAEGYHRFAELPLIGWFASIGFCCQLMVFLVYIAWRKRTYFCMTVWLPALLTMVMTFFSPIVYTRYMLPMFATLPMCLESYLIEQRTIPQNNDL